jgi:hypothetical protein
MVVGIKACVAANVMRLVVCRYRHEGFYRLVDVAWRCRWRASWGETAAPCNDQRDHPPAGQNTLRATIVTGMRTPPTAQWKKPVPKLTWYRASVQAGYRWWCMCRQSWSCYLSLILAHLFGLHFCRLGAPALRGVRLGGPDQLGRLCVVFFARCSGTAGAIIHKGVELGLVFGVAKALEELFKVALFVFKAAQRVGLIGVKR